MSSRNSWLVIAPTNAVESSSITGNTVSEFSFMRCKASSTGSWDQAFGMVRRAMTPKRVSDRDCLGTYRSKPSDTISGWLAQPNKSSRAASGDDPAAGLSTV